MWEILGVHIKETITLTPWSTEDLGAETLEKKLFRIGE